jgi:hypothetical protein
MAQKVNTMTVTDGLHFGPNAKIIGSSNSALVIKDMVEFKGNITNDGRIGDEKTGLRFKFRKQPITGNIINNGIIEGRYYGLKVDSPINGTITNHGTIISHADDRVDNSKLNPAAIYVQNNITNISNIINYGIIKGRKFFYDKSQSVTVKLTSHGQIEGWFDCLSDKAEIINTTAAVMIGPEIDTAVLTNSGKIIIHPEKIVTKTTTAKDPEIALKVTQKCTVEKDGVVEINGEYWPAEATINNGIFRVKDIYYGHANPRDLTLKNNGIFIVERIIAKDEKNTSNNTGLPNLAITNTKELTMHQGNIIKSYTDTNGKLNIVLANLTDTVLTTTEASKFSATSVIELKPQDFKQLKLDAKGKDATIVIVASGSPIDANTNIVKSGHDLLQIANVSNKNNQFSATLQFLSPSKIIDKKEISEDIATFADSLFDTTSEPANKEIIDLMTQSYGDISQVTTVAEIKKYIEAITPEKADVAGDVVSEMSGQSENSVVNHVSSVRSGINTGDFNIMQDVAVWGQVILNTGKKDPTTLSSGYDSDFKGFTLGMERDFNKMIYGIAWSYVIANTKIDNSKNKAQDIDVNLNSVALYLNKTINKLFFETVINAGRAKYSVQSGKSRGLLFKSISNTSCKWC